MQTVPSSPLYSPASVEIKLELPRVLLMGLRRSGKTSIKKVVFQKMAPNETIFLESTTKMGVEIVNSFLKFSIADFPGQINFTESSSTFDVGAIFGEASDEVANTCGAVIFVIDAQDDYYEALPRLYRTISTAYKYNPNLYFEIFIHKVDGLSDELKIETQRDIHQRVTDELLDLGILDKIHISFYLTSIYDHSIYEAFSKVIQKLIPLLPTLENILNTLCSSSSIEKAFLFDSFTKIYLATDASPVDIQSYELCSDMIDVMIDLESIYTYTQDPRFPTQTLKKSDHQQGCVTRLSNGTVLCLVQMDKLSLVSLLRNENYVDKTGFLEFNFQKFKETLWNVFLIH